MKSTNNPLTKIVIVGAGSFGREVLWTLRDCNKQSKEYDILGFIDDDETLNGKVINNLPVLGGLEWLDLNTLKDVGCVVAINNSKSRQKITERLEKMNMEFPTIIHPSVIHSEYVEIGKGTIIQAGTILTTDIKIGNHVHINLACTIGHDSKLGDFVTLNPGVHINGDNEIGDGVYVGSGATTINKIKIGKWSIIGAGTVLIDNVSKFSLYVGVPGKFKKKLLEG